MDRETFAARMERGALLLDGGLGSLFIAEGLEAGRDPVGWNIERPDRVEAAHRAYAEAGCHIVHANTFGANPPKLETSGFAGRCREMNAAAVALVRLAGEGVLVAGDIGPTGLLRMPAGTATVRDFDRAFLEQARALAEAGADLLSIETMYDLEEAASAVRAARETGLPVLASMTFTKRKRGFFTIMGDSLSQSLAILADAGADAVGFNCSVTSEVMVEMVREAHRDTDAPIVAQPNAGQPRATPEGVVYDASPEDFARDLEAMVREGARLVGGCCGTTPEFLRIARARLGSAGLLAEAEGR
jgi:5-methyltetrahydrofolate--homocysteine methyltransferase